jgi:hypothetical protein
MYPAPQLGHVGIVLPPDAVTLSPPAAVTTLPTHQRPPTVGVDNPAHQNGEATNPTVVYITSIPSTSSAEMTSTATPASPMSSDNDNGECRLLGPFAVLVQLALGGLALLSLVYKRWRERPQRPIKVWWFDVSKQVVGSVLVHVANVFMSMLTSGRFSIRLVPSTVAARMALDLMKRSGGNGYTPNPCSLYLLNLAIDVSFASCRAHTPRSTSLTAWPDRQPSASRFSSCSSVSTPPSLASHRWASPANPSRAATTVAHPKPSGG